MALYDGFFDAVYDEVEEKFDREYDSAAFVDYFHQFIGNGVCVHNNPDSFRVRLSGGAAVIHSGFLFLQGCWLKNTADYTLAVPSGGQYAVVAHLSKGKRMFEILAQSTAQSYPDSLVLALVNVSAGTVEDTRYHTDICGVIDSAGNLTFKIQYALDFIDNKIEARLQAAEASIRARSAELDNRIAEVQRIANSMVPPPVGSIKYSAADDPGEGWLRCDGSYISETEYPELVSAIGKLTAKDANIQYLWSYEGREVSTFSNAALYRNNICVFCGGKTSRFWVIDETGLQNMPVYGISELNINLPVYLSIVNGTVFLTQRSGNDILIFMAKNFNPSATRLDMESYSTQTYYDSLTGVSSLYLNRRNAYIVPYVIYQDGFYYMMSGATQTTNGMTTQYKLLYLKFTSFQDITHGMCDVSHSSYWTSVIGSVADYAPLAMLGFSDKNSQECVYTEVLNSNPYNNNTFRSTLKSVYNIASRNVSSGGLATFNVYALPVVGGDQVFFGLAIYEDSIVIASAKNGGAFTRIRAPIKLPSSAKTFYDSAVYIASKQIWLIFVGTGFVIAKNLDVPSDIGYLDTTSRIYGITRFGGVLYSQSLNALYFSGMSANNTALAAKFTLDDFFKYSSTGTWLPTLSYGGIPAYIKAKEGTG